MQTGDILAYTWGYEQTNANFFQVTRATEKSVWIRPIAGSETATGDMTGLAKPIINRFTGPEKRKKIQHRDWSDGAFIDMPHGVACPYKRPIRVSHYA